MPIVFQKLEDIGCGLAWGGMGSAMRHCQRHTTWRGQPQLNPYQLSRCPEEGPRLLLLDEGEKYVTDGPKSLRARNNITIGTWNVRSLRAAGKVEELTHEMKRYQWNIFGLSEVRWKNFSATSTLEGHKLFFSGCEDRHENGVGFLIHKDTVNAIMGCWPVSSWLITIHLKATLFNITIIQAHAPTTDYDDDDIEDFYDQLQEVIDQAPKKDILEVQGDWNANIGEDASKNWKGTCSQYCNPETNEMPCGLGIE